MVRHTEGGAVLSEMAGWNLSTTYLHTDTHLRLIKLRKEILEIKKEIIYRQIKLGIIVPYSGVGYTSCK